LDKIQIVEHCTKQRAIDIMQFNSATEIIYSKPTLVGMVTKYENFNTKFTITHLIFYGQFGSNNLMLSQTFEA